MNSTMGGLQIQPSMLADRFEVIHQQLLSLPQSSCFEPLLSVMAGEFSAHSAFIASFGQSQQLHVQSRWPRCETGSCSIEAVAVECSPFSNPENQSIVYIDGEAYQQLAKRWPLADDQAHAMLAAKLPSSEGLKGGILVLLLQHSVGHQLASAKALFQIFHLRSAMALQHLQQSQRLNRKIRLLENTNRQLEVANHVYDFSCDGIMISDAANNVVSVNHALEKMSGYHQRDLLGHNPRQLNSGLQSKAFYQQLWQQLQDKGFWQGELWNRHKNGTTYPVQTSLVAIKDQAGEIVNHIAIQRDLSEKKEAQEIISYQATHDALTGLLNRYEFNGQLGHQLAHSQRHQEQAAFLLLDLDDFKSVNDSLGHAEGDYLLTQVSARLRGSLRSDDILARLGGDEFAIFANFDQASCVEVLANKILGLFDPPFLLENGGTLSVTTSMGISLYPSDGESSKELLACADQALYSAKSDSFGRYEFFTEELRVQALRHQKIRQRLTTALDKKTIDVKFQPIVNVSDGKISHCEALARWQDAELGTVRPDEFIRVAENTGMMGKLGLQLADKAIAAISQLNQRLQQPISVSINRSPQEFLGSNAQADILHGLLEKYQMPSEQVCVELTESLMIKNPNLAKLYLDGLKSKGFTLAMDDFGTGYSSLAYLKHFPFDILKIDQGFVRDMDSVGEDYRLVKTMIDMAKNFKLKTIAEGVETQQQFDLLKQLGCDYIQGYLISPAVSLDELEPLIEARQGA